MSDASITGFFISLLMDNQTRVVYEAELVAKGYSPQDAAKEWIKQYDANKL